MRRRTYLTCKPKYIVKKEEGIVICVLSCHMYLCVHPCYDVMIWNLHKNIMPNVSSDGRFTVSTVARCSKEDAFDELKGKRIAESKAKIKAFNIASKVYNAHVKNLENNNKIIIENMNNCLTVMKEEIKHLNELMK